MDNQVEQKMKVLVKWYEVTISVKTDSEEEADITFDISNSCDAESILRGFVHSGYKTSIGEIKEIKDVTQEELQQLYADGHRVDVINEYDSYYSCPPPMAGLNPVAKGYR